MDLQKVTNSKNCVKKLVFAGILKVNDENSRIRIQDPDPLVRGLDPRIRIHIKMSWIRNTAGYHSVCTFFNPKARSKIRDVKSSNHCCRSRSGGSVIN
jgi:hypothetical protein